MDRSCRSVDRRRYATAWIFESLPVRIETLNERQIQTGSRAIWQGRAARPPQTSNGHDQVATRMPRRALGTPYLVVVHSERLVAEPRKCPRLAGGHALHPAILGKTIALGRPDHGQIRQQHRRF